MTMTMKQQQTDRRKLQSNIDNTAKDIIKDNVKEEKEDAKDMVKDVVKDKNNYKNYFSLSFYRADKDNVLTPYSIDNDISNEALNSQLNNDFTNYINDLSKYINNNLQNNSASNLFSLTDNVKLANLENELKEKEELLKAVSEEVNVENNEKEIASNSSEQTQIQIDISYLEREIEKLKKENVQKTISKTIAEKAKEANIEFGTIATLTYNKDDNGNTTDKATISLFEFGNKEKSKDYISYTELELTNGDIVRIRDINNDKIKNFLKEGEIEEEVLKTYLKNDFFITIQRKGSEKEELIKYDDEIENGYSCSDLFDLPEKVKQNYQDLEKEETLIQAIENDSVSSLLQNSSNLNLPVEEENEKEESKSFVGRLNKNKVQYEQENIIYNN